MSPRPERPRKRAAFEPAARLAQPVGFDPEMKRPVTTVVGGVLVLLRVLAGVLWLAAVAFNWGDISAALDAALGEGTLIFSTSGWVPAAVLAVLGAPLAVTAVLAVLILRGQNLPRVLVMMFCTVSISAAFVAWWVQGQDIRLETTLLTLSFDILVLLALSSRSAAAYARRNERR